MFFSNIEIFGILINEPGTLVSDIIMGFASLFFYFKLIAKARNKQQKFLSYFFLFLSISSIIAAFAHGFFYIFGKFFHILSWSCAGLAIFYILSGSSSMINNSNLKRIYKIFNMSHLILLMLILIIYPKFDIVKVSFAFSLIGILIPLYLVDTVKNSCSTNLYIFLAIAIACVPALFHTVEFEFGLIFNMNDLSHFILIICFYFIYLGLDKRFFIITESDNRITEKVFANSTGIKNTKF